MLGQQQQTAMHSTNTTVQTDIGNN